MSLDIVILAAGQGTRMRSALPKVLHPVAGQSMLGHVVSTARALQPRSIQVVIGHGAEQVRQRLVGDDLNYVVQAEQLGTGHAVAQALPNLSAERVLILYGDVPLIEAETLQRLLQKVGPEQLALLTVTLDDPTGYGRIVRDAQGEVQAIVEHKDASAEQKAIREGNTGILAVPGSRIGEWLGRLSNSNAQGEYYLTDVIAMAVADGLRVATEQPQDAMEVQGANFAMAGCTCGMKRTARFMSIRSRATNSSVINGVMPNWARMSETTPVTANPTCYTRNEAACSSPTPPCSGHGDCAKKCAATARSRSAGCARSTCRNTAPRCRQHMPHLSVT
ncbi:NTP transferase domain-containing protein [Methylobacterium organophilum]|nr:NTP transferase domain-containing protein [Methylobacterium organophilum]